MFLGSTQHLTEISTSNLSGSRRRPALKADNLTAICELIVYRNARLLTFCGPASWGESFMFKHDLGCLSWQWLTETSTCFGITRPSSEGKWQLEIYFMKIFTVCLETRLIKHGSCQVYYCRRVKIGKWIFGHYDTQLVTKFYKSQTHTQTHPLESPVTLFASTLVTASNGWGSPSSGFLNCHHALSSATAVSGPVLLITSRNGQHRKYRPSL
jgi:hypothetical protein